MKNKKVIFLPGSYYLSLPLFFQIVKNNNNKSFHDIFFHTDDPILCDINNQYEKLSEIKKTFSEVEKISNSDLRVLRRYFKYNWVKRFIYFLSFVKELRKIRSRIEKKLKEISPSLIVSVGDSSIFLMCNSWAHKNNIPFVVLQPAFLNFYKKEFLIRLKHQILNDLFLILIGTPISSDSHLFGDGFPGNYLLIWSDSIKQKYNNTRLEQRTIVTGNPLHDTHSKTHIKTVDWSKIGCNPIIGRKIVAICPQTLDRFSHIISKKDADEINNIYYQLIDNNPEIFFLIKTHPIQKNDYSFYCNLFYKIKHNNYFISKNADLDSVFDVSDLQISFSSATSFDAIINNVPVLLIKPHLLEIPEYFNNDIALKANTYIEAIRQVEYGLTNEYKDIFRIKREQYLIDLGLFDGKSTERVISEIEKILLNK